MFGRATITLGIGLHSSCVFLFVFVRFRISQRRKLCMPVQLLSAQFFSHFGELWLAWSHGSGITSGMCYILIASGQNAYIQITPGKNTAARLAGQSELAVAGSDSPNWGWRRRVRPYGGMCVLQAC